MTAVTIVSPGGGTDLARVLALLTSDPRWEGVLYYDAFQQRVAFAKEPPYGGPTRTGHLLADADVHAAALWISNTGRVPSVAVVSEALQILAKRVTKHAVREYLERLVWDGVERIGRPAESARDAGTRSWLCTYLGSDDVTYTRDVGRCWLVSAVARVMAPGCQADGILALWGPQGNGKSTALRTLATADAPAGGAWFSEDVGDVRRAKEPHQLAGCWIVEIDDYPRRPAEDLKRFCAQTVDRYRVRYARHATDFPRQCVFAATSNQPFGEGSRRLWSVATRAVDVAALQRDRDQLWAEALTLYRCNEPWWLEAAS